MDADIVNEIFLDTLQGCWYRIFFALDLRARPRKIQKYYSPSMGPWEHLKWRGITRSYTRALKVSFSVKMTKTPLVNPGLAEGQTRLKPSKNNTFHSFTSSPSFSKVFGNFNQVWLSLTLSWFPIGLETLILIRPSERVETNVIAKIIKFSVQRLFMGRNRS